MPPKKSSQRSSQDTLQTALEKLCEEIGKEKRKVANIKALEVLPAVKEGLRAARKASQPIDHSFVRHLFDALDNNGQDLCSRINPPFFSVIIDIVLQAEYRVEGERIIHLLTASLFRDSKTAKTQRELPGRKDSIGRESLQSIWTYFLDADNHPDMRRWVGLLCIQLLQGSETNVERLGFTSEDSRRQIGIVVVSEPNEIVRTVAGQLVKLLLAAKFELADLWPIDIDKVMYAGFPPSSQDNKGWSSAFQDYIDFLYDNGYVENEGIGQLYFATLFQLRPEHPFGVRDHNIDVFICGEVLTIHAPGRGHSLDQILDIPLESLSRVTIIRDAYSQHQKQGILQLELFEYGNSGVYLDAEPIKLIEMHLSVKEDSLQSIKIRLSQLYPDLKILENTTDMPRSSDELNRSSQRTGVSFIMQVDGAESANSETVETVEEDLPDTQQESAISAEASGEIQDANDDIDMEDIYDASPLTQKSQPVERPTKESMKPPPKPNFRNKKAVKPKAKKPIITAQRRGDESTKAPAGSSHVLNEPSRKGSKSIWDIEEKEVQAPSQKVANNVRKTIPTLKKTPVAKAQSQSKPNSRLSASVSTKASTKASTIASQGKKAIDRFEDDSITSPDMNDASTPKITTGGRSFKTPTATSAKPTQGNNQKSNNDASTSASRKKYSVQRVLGASKATAVDAESQKTDAGSKSKGSKTISKVPTKYTKPSTSQTKAAVKGRSEKQIGGKADNKRKSAPAAMQQTVPTRVSQRQAATKANAKLHEVDTSEGEEEEIEDGEVAKVTKSKPEPKPNKGTSQEKEKAPRRKAKSDATHDVQQVRAVEDNEDIFQLQQEDARSLGLVAEDLLTDHDDLYGASPKCTKTAPDTNIARNNKLAEGKKPAKSPNVDYLSSLGDIMDDLVGEPLEGLPALQNGSEQKLQCVQAKKDLLEKKVTAKLENREQEALSIPTEIDPTSLRKGHETEKLQDVFMADEPPTKGLSPKTPMAAEPALVAPPPTKVSPEKEFVPGYSPDAPAPEDVPDAVSPATWNQQEREVPAQQESPGSDQIIALGEANTERKNNADVSAQKKSPAGDQAIALSMINTEKVPVATEKEERSDNSPLSDPPNSPPLVMPPLLSPTLPVIVEKELNRLQQNKDTKEPSLNSVEARYEAKKRKATAADATPPKRRRAEPKNTPVIDLPSPGEGNRVKKAKSPKARISRPTAEKSASPAMRRSPRPAERKNTFEMSKVDTSLVDDTISRKPTIVAFGTKGARNQGPPTSHGKDAQEHSTPAPEVVNVRKRKLDDSQLSNVQSPPNKRQSCSPGLPEEIDQSLPQLPVFGSSPPVPTYKGPTNRRKISRPSSQSSRVDLNGSPIANTAAQDDHIRKLKERLAEDIQARKRSQNVATTTEVVAENVQSQKQSKDNIEAAIETLPVGAPAQPRARRPSEIFGPRIRLENKPKARPSSPETAATQYLPHKKTGKGQYEAMDTKEVIALDKPLADPFANNTRKPSDFTQRLRAGVSNGQQRKSLRFSQEDTEKTLVDVENLENHKRYSHSDPSDMSTGTSVESGSSEPSRSPLKERRNEMWSMAIRPHYKSLHDVVHRIADEMIIHLAKEEDKVGLLVGQYKQNGTKILDNLTRKRETERATILQKLNHKKKEMVSIYTEAKEFVMETAEDLKDSISQFEKDWRKQQQAIQEKISEGRKLSE